MALQVTVRKAGEVTIVELQGRATIGPGNDQLSARLREVLEGGSIKLVVNLKGTSQIDSTGISTLVRTFVTLGRTPGGGLRLVGPSGRVREVLEVTRLLGSIPTFDNEEQALASFP